jgi:hypothetical protein
VGSVRPVTRAPRHGEPTPARTPRTGSDARRGPEALGRARDRGGSRRAESAGRAAAGEAARVLVTAGDGREGMGWRRQRGVGDDEIVEGRK